MDVCRRPNLQLDRSIPKEFDSRGQVPAGFTALQFHRNSQADIKLFIKNMSKYRERIRK